MPTSPAADIPAEVLERWRALQRLRARRAAGRCDCHCRQCAAGPGRAARPASRT
jgi:hypothetical protein